ncbi:glycosyltransferase family 2 protein [Aeribacillus sp. FSL M8-0235]|uniref:glycosyltransferase family 2 protein n=1 Tax=Aeribacillus sp. FSL M8-0235 TaxID=2954576 RepID=UPI0030FBE531
MRDKPLVSILINNYNYGNYISEAIRSALNQTYRNIEIIVVDDGSTDNSRDIINSFRGILPVFKENGGQASAFNIGFKYCKGEIICILDSDDIFHPNKVEIIVEYFKNNPGYDWLIHKMNHIDNNSNNVLIAEHEDISKLLSKSGDYRKKAKYGQIDFYLPATSALAFRKSLIQKITPIPEKLRITADNYLKYASLMLSPVLVCNQVLSSQRIHGNNLYTNQNRKTKDFRKKSRFIRYHVASGLWNLEKKQLQSGRIAFQVLKSSIRDFDVPMLIKSGFLLIKCLIGRIFNEERY